MTSLLPVPEQYFTNLDGTPLAGGTVQTLIPNSSTPKATWQDSGQVVVNTNPIVLDAAGRAIIYGDGDYRLIVKDAVGNLIYDQLTASTLPESAISPAMLPVTSALTLATARTLMGIDTEIAVAIAGIHLLTGPTGPASTVPGPAGPPGPAGSSANTYAPILAGTNPGFLALPNVNSALNFFFQFGQSVTAPSSVTVNFVTPFPNGVFGVWLTPLTTLADINLSSPILNPAGFVCSSSSVAFPGGGFGGPIAFAWLAVGY